MSDDNMPEVKPVVEVPNSNAAEVSSGSDEHARPTTPAGDLQRHLEQAAREFKQDIKADGEEGRADKENVVDATVSNIKERLDQGDKRAAQAAAAQGEQDANVIDLEINKKDKLEDAA